MSALNALSHQRTPGGTVRALGLVAALGAASLIVSGCASTTPDDESATDLIRIATQLEIAATSFDAAIAPGGSAQLAVYSLYDPLYKFDDEGIPQPYLVTEYEPNEDYTAQTFTLRDDVLFHDGSHLTAEDVKFSLERTAGLTPELPAPTNKSYLPAIDRVEVDDEFVFTVYTPRPAPVLVNGLAFTSGLIMPKAAVEAAGGIEQFVEHPIGSGPYVFDSLAVGQSLRFERNDDYWGELPTFEAAEIFFVSDPAARVARLESGDVDYASAVQPSQISGLESSGFVVTTSPAGNNLAIGFQMRNLPEFTDPRVGQAFNLAVDKEAILETIYQGTMTPIASLDPTNVAPEIEPYPYDPDAAVALLEDANWDFDRTLELAMNPGALLGQDVVQAVVSDLSKIGVKVEINLMEVPTMLAQRRDHTLPSEMILGNLSNSLFNGSASLAVLTLCADAGLNYWCDPELDTMIAQAQTIADVEERRAMEREIFQYNHDNPPAIFIGQFSVIGAMRDGITWSPTPGQEKVILEQFGIAD